MDPKLTAAQFGNVQRFPYKSKRPGNIHASFSPFVYILCNKCLKRQTNGSVVRASLTPFRCFRHHEERPSQRYTIFLSVLEQNTQTVRSGVGGDFSRQLPSAAGVTRSRKSLRLVGVPAHHVAVYYAVERSGTGPTLRVVQRNVQENESMI